MNADILIIGAGAAGLAAAIFAGRTAPGANILLLEGARKPGAKILVSGGGRCNVTNASVQPQDFNGGSRHVITRVLKAFDEQRTIDWMREMGVDLKLEPTGKYFPVSDDAQTVLAALLAEAGRVGAELRTGMRVADVIPEAEGFVVHVERVAEPLRARRLVIATGGLALPRSGSDGWGLELLARLGHDMVPTHPALVPLVYERDVHAGTQLGALSGLAFDGRLDVRGPTGSVLASASGAILLTHFGISGPAALDISRHLLHARASGPAVLTLSHPSFRDVEEADHWLVTQAAGAGRRTVLHALQGLFPDRFARWLATDLDSLASLRRDERRALATRLARLELPIAGDRGYSFSETTAGGVALGEVDPRTMESRRTPGLYLCGEVLDVDGRIGGFNFQWAWASGYLAGTAAARRAIS